MSSAVERRVTLTAEELLTLPDRAAYELVDGVIMDLNVGALSSLVATKLSARLEVFCDRDQLAWVFGANCPLRCYTDRPNTIRKPDVCYVLQDRLPVGQLAESFLTIASDLVVEVVSPNDLAYEVDRKVKEDLAAGVRLVWVVNPENRSARVYRLDGTAN